MTTIHQSPPAQPVVSLIEWHSTKLTPDDARQLADKSTAAFSRILGLIEIRFFGDFETGRHFYLQVWRDRASLDAYMASESMLRIREIAAPYVEGRPARQVLADYSVRAIERAGRRAGLAQVRHELLDAALLRGDFVLSSGARSNYYLDKYRFETRPALLRNLAEHLADLVPAGVDRLAGTELGAVALAAAVSLQTGLPFVIVRKVEKDYSTANLIEGELRPGETVLVLEDIVTSGAQSIKAADRVVAAGGVVVGILAVVDRQEGGQAKIAEAGYKLTSLFTREELGI
jgi:orotate phosphoribosyltransferase